MIKSFKSSTFVLICFGHLTISAMAYYQPKEGRFLQRDPLGVNPAGGLQNPYSPRWQYKDGLNIYEYVQSIPLMKVDAWGLESDKGLACCKIQDMQMRYYPLPGGGVYSSGSTTSCSQVTINAGSKSPGRACRCQFQNRANVHVYAWHTGKCCSCTVEMRGVKSQMMGIPLHFWLIVRCEKDQDGIDNSHLVTIFSDTFKVQDLLSDERVDYGVTLRRTKISCSNAAIFKKSFSGAYTRFWLGLWCFGNSWAGFDYIASQCP